MRGSHVEDEEHDETDGESGVTKELCNAHTNNTDMTEALNSPHMKCPLRMVGTR